MIASLPVFVAALGWALIHFLWQGVLIGAAAALLLAVLRNARPQQRYLVACLALALCMALPLIGIWRGLPTDGVFATPITQSSVDAVAVSNTSIAMPLASWRTDLQVRLPWIVATWSLGATLLSLRMLLGLAWVGRIRRATSAAVNPAWQLRLDRLASRLRISRSIGLRVADDLDSPVAAGWWRPIVIVPAALIANMPVDLLEALLAHELAHIKRHDYLINLIQSAIEALLFYHPVVWWLSRQIRIEREQIADDLAASALGEPRRLALALQELERFQFSTPHLAPAAHGGNLMSRIQRLIRPNVHTLNWRLALPILGLTAVCLTVYAQGTSTPTRGKAQTTVQATAAEDATDAVDPVEAVDAVEPVEASDAADAVDATEAGDAMDASEATEATPVTPVTPVTPTTPTTSTVPTTPKTQGLRISRDDNSRDSFALAHAGSAHTTFSGNTAELAQIERLKREVAGDFLWFRHGGKAYLVRDPALVAKATQVWQPSEALSVRMEALSAQMEPHSQEMEALSKQMETLDARMQPNNAALDKLNRDMEVLNREQEALSVKMQPLADRMQNANSSEQDALSQKMDALNAQMEAVNQKAQAISEKMSAQSQQMQANSEPMQALSEKMQKASAPMQELGRKMEVLGKQQELLSHQADRDMQALMDEALRSGKAVPATSGR
ncbi:MAG TPA: M56 family metallopeptidase [Arenimonas sp.]|uniref:M56 family metallopeptidase n=1 Tax=Arenimonas sp. TaxID=1872635 RepID=UPI002CA5B1A2|nr:M56 family metallopeptidase [Arenimonas sp.]HMB58171.1 M56 family metallopeptidase [Arenimonas sp.]